MWKWFLGAFILLVMLCGGGAALLFGTEKGRSFVSQLKPQEKATEVRLQPADKGDLIKVVNAPGSVEPKTKVEISAQVVARIIALPFREGDQVKAGDVVVRLDGEDLAAALESARASKRGQEARLAGARASLAESLAELGRVQELYDTKDVSKSSLESAEAVYLRSEAELKATEHQIEIAQANIVRAEKDLQNTTIVSPMDGVLTHLNAEVGELVLVGTLNNAASVILEIADLTKMIVKTRVDESNVGPVKSGQAATVFINAYPDRPFKGVVELVGLKRETDRDGTGYFETEVFVQQEPGEFLRQGLTANVDIDVETYKDVVKVPSQSILERRVDELPREIVDGSANVDKNKVFARVVYVIENGKAKAVPVAVGASDLTHTVILSGLEPGAPVVTGPFKVLVNLKDKTAIVDETTVKKPEKKQEVADKSAGGGKG